MEPLNERTNAFVFFEKLVRSLNDPIILGAGVKTIVISFRITYTRTRQAILVLR